MLTSAKLRRARHKKLYLLKLNMGVCLCAKCEVSSIILTSFRKGAGGNLSAPLGPPQNEPLKSPPRLGLSRARLAINKKQRYFYSPDYQLAENLILCFGL